MGSSAWPINMGVILDKCSRAMLDCWCSVRIGIARLPTWPANMGILTLKTYYCCHSSRICIVKSVSTSFFKRKITNMVSVSMVLSCKDDSSQPPVSHYHVLEPPKLHKCHYSHFIIWLFALIPQFHQLSAFNI